MPDDGFPDSYEELAEDLELTNVLMGWDGDPCECSKCDCPNVREGGNSPSCSDCENGRHWPRLEPGEG